MNFAQPKITIVTPSYNSGKYLEATILSVIEQNYSNLEFIIIDGGSTDGSLEIIQKYDKNVSFWISEKDKGQSEAINKGFAKTTGNIVTWLNSDDVLMPGALHKVASYFKDNERAGVIHGKTILFGETQKELLRGAEADHSGCQYFAGMSFPQPSSFFRKEVLDQIGFLDPQWHYGMDYDFFLRAACIAPFLRVEDTFSKYRLHIESKSMNAPRKFASEWQFIFSKFLRSIENSEEVVHRMKMLNCYSEGTDYYKISKKFEPHFLLATFSYFLYYQITFLYKSGDVAAVYKFTRYLRDNDPAFFERFELEQNYFNSKYLNRRSLLFLRWIKELWHSFQS